MVPLENRIKWRYRHPILFWSIQIIIFLALAFALLVSSYVVDTLKTLPEVPKEALQSDASSNMYAEDGTLIWSSAKNKRIYVPIEDVPQSYIDLLLSTEDRDFYKNAGFSPKGIINAGLSYVGEKLGRGEARGGSTIEQQLIKLAVFSTDVKDRTIDRKAKEFFLANQLYQNYDKDTILEFYINKIYMGEGAYGAQTIAQVYFGKDLKDLTLSQQALIAGLGQAPSDYNLYDDPDLTKRRRDIVLESALATGKISQTEFDAAISENPQDGLKPRFWMEEEIQRETRKYPEYVQSTILEVKAMGYDLEKTPLQIQTHLNTEMNNHVRGILNDRKEWFQDDNQQAAATITNPQTGAVLAQIGGRHIDTLDGFNRATSTTRSTGSSTKPFFAALAMENLGWGTNAVINAARYQYANSDVVAYNYGGTEYGDVSLKYALEESLNTPFLRIVDEVGVVPITSKLEQFDIQQDPFYTANALGLNASTEDLARILGSFATLGVDNGIHYVKSLTFPDGSVKEIEPNDTRAWKASTAYMINHILQTPPSQNGMFKLGYIPNITQAVKTGTVAYPTDAGFGDRDAMDLWTAGYTKERVLALWTGYDEPMSEGGQLSEDFMYKPKAELYKLIMTYLTEGTDTSPWTPPESVQRISGQGLKAQYQPLDQGATFQLDPPYGEPFDPSLYEVYLKEKVDNPPRATQQETDDVVPKDYEFGAWKKTLKKELEEYERRLERERIPERRVTEPRRDESSTTTTEPEPREGLRGELQGRDEPIREFDSYERDFTEPESTTEDGRFDFD